jgi:hypothetical protein
MELGKPRVTLYASPVDRALALSKGVHGVWRLAWADSLVVLPHMEAVEA